MDPIVGDIGAGTLLGRYELLSPIAKGGMAMVWAARLQGSRGFQKIVAVKTMLPTLSEDPMFEQMFLDEASLASRVRHPNVVEILDLGEQAGVLYLVMDWIEGDPLSMLLKRCAPKSMPFPVAVRMVLQACQGLHAAHELKDDDGALVGLVHRDVSPQNVLVTYGGVVKLVDFGVAKATGRVSVETGAGQVKGKIPYMSPEQATGGVVDRRTDVFAMGILLYMMTTGRHPFRRENEAQTLANITSSKPVMPPRSVVPGYPPELSEIIVRALAKDPEKRLASANEMTMALDGLPRRLRAGSDEDVASFVQQLLGDRIEQKKTLLRDALHVAGERAAGRLSVPSLHPETSLQSQTGLSAYGPVSSQPGPSSQSGVIERKGEQRRLTRALALVAGVLSCALVIGAVALTRAPRVPPSPQEKTDLPPPKPVSAAAPASLVPTTEPVASAIATAAAPETQDAAPAPAAPARRSGARTSAPPPLGSSSKPQPADKPPPKRTSEKPFMSPIRDPGF